MDWDVIAAGHVTLMTDTMRVYASHIFLRDRYSAIKHECWSVLR